MEHSRNHCAGKTLTLWVNGAVTCQFQDCGREQDPPRRRGGGYRIEFRNLRSRRCGEGRPLVERLSVTFSPQTAGLLPDDW